MKKVVLNIAAIAMLFAASCSKNSDEVTPQSGGSSEHKTSAKAKHLPNTLAYYDAELYEINLMEMKQNPTSAILEHNHNYNEIYIYEELENYPYDFTPIIDAIPGDGMNPHWKEVEIHFTSGHTPYQLKSDTEVDAAVDAGIITLKEDHEIYICSVIGKKPAQ